MFSTYSSPAGEIDINAMVRTGDIALVPYGYHGPAVAAPGYDLYYLNVMAGPDPEREWLISDDPAHAWVRDTWAGQDVRRPPPVHRRHDSEGRPALMATTKRMTVSQALVEFLAHQWTVDGDIRERTIPGMFGIFGHGNVAGIGQALKQFNVEQPDLMPYYQARNEQAMVHQAVGYARMHRRRGTFASAASVGPGAANMLTGAALATTNRLPALLLPSDTFATRVADPVLQQLEQPWDIGLTVNDAFRPLSKFFDRVQRPEQLYSIALAAMRVLTDPAETGAVTIALPEDVQAEALDVPARVPAGPRVAHPSAAARARPARPCRRRDPLREATRSSSPAAASSTRAPRTSCAPSWRPPASRSAPRRPAAGCSTGTTRSTSAASARPARWRRTGSPPRPTSSSASARATATSRPRRARRSRTRTCGSSTSTSPRSTRTSTARSCR